MSSTRSNCFFLVVVACVAIGSSVHGDSQSHATKFVDFDDNKSLPVLTEELARRMLSGCKNLTSMPNVYRIDFVDTVEKREPDVGKEGGSNIEFRSIACFAQKGELLRRQFQTFSIEPNGQTGDATLPRPVVYVFDGEKTVKDGGFQSNGGVEVMHISIDRAEAERSCPGPINVSAIPLLLRTLEAFGGEPDERQLVDCVGGVDGERAFFRCETKLGGRIGCDFEATDGMLLPVRISVQYSNGTLLETAISEYSFLNAQRFPTAIVRRESQRDELLESHELSVESLSGDNTVFPAAFFEISIPEDVFVYDIDLGKTLRNQTVIARYLDSVDRESRPSAVGYLLFFNVTLLIVAIAWYAARKLKS